MQHQKVLERTVDKLGGFNYGTFNTRKKVVIDWRITVDASNDGEITVKVDSLVPILDRKTKTELVKEHILEAKILE